MRMIDWGSNESEESGLFLSHLRCSSNVLAEITPGIPPMVTHD